MRDKIRFIDPEKKLEVLKIKHIVTNLNFKNKNENEKEIKDEKEIELEITNYSCLLS